MLLGAALLAGCAATPAAKDGAAPAVEGPTGISGRVTDRQGVPVAGAFVNAYRSSRGGLRGPADFQAVVEADGSYFLDLVEGRYYLVARSRSGGRDAGPPRPGDAWALYPRNPVTVRAGWSSRSDFVLQGLVRPMLMREGSLVSGDTGIRGRVVDAAGAPVPGAFALAYRTADFHRMPEMTSLAADGDGRFELYLPEAGLWCFAVRTEVRGQPRAGELYGLLGPGTQACREIAAGEILEVGEIPVTPYRR